MKKLFLLLGLVRVAIFLTSCCSAPPLISDDLLDCDTKTYNKPREANIMLFNAAKAGDAKTCKEQLAKNANINVADRLGQSALMWAAWQGSDEVVKCLLEFDRNIREKTKNKRKRKTPIFLEYSTESKPKYNPLFSLVMARGMQVPNTIECINLLLKNEADFSKKQTLLTKEDFLGESILHKVVRSGSIEYLELAVEKLQVLLKDDFLRFINIKNSSGESPLMLAVKEKNAKMVHFLIEKGADILIKDEKGRNLSILAFDNGDGDYDTYLEIMQARLRKHIKERNEIKKEHKKLFTEIYPRRDDKLKKALDDYFDRVRKDRGNRKNEKENPFYKTYERFVVDKVENPEDLIAENYINKKDDFFMLITQKHLNEKEIDIIKATIKENPFLLVCDYQRNEDMKRLSALHIAIEQRNEYLFDAIFSSIDMNKLKRTAYPDYLHCAIINNNPSVIKKLLKYNKNPTGITGHIIENLMSPHNTNPNPIVQYLKHDDLRNDRELLGEVLTYYKSELKKSSSNLANYAFAEALKYDEEELLLFLYEHSMPKTQFYTTEHEKGRYLQFILLEKGFFKALKMFIKNSSFFEANWHTVKDEKNNNKLFEELINEMQRTKEVDEIIKLYESEKEQRTK